MEGGRVRADALIHVIVVRVSRVCPLRQRANLDNAAPRPINQRRKHIANVRLFVNQRACQRGRQNLARTRGLVGRGVEKFSGEGHSSVAPAQEPNEQERERADNQQHDRADERVKTELLGEDGAPRFLFQTRLFFRLPRLDGLCDNAVWELRADFPFDARLERTARKFNRLPVRHLPVALCRRAGIGHGGDLGGVKCGGEMHRDAGGSDGVSAVSFNELVPELVAVGIDAQGIREPVAQFKCPRLVGRRRKKPCDLALAVVHLHVKGIGRFGDGAFVGLAIFAHPLEYNRRNFVERNRAKGITERSALKVYDPRFGDPHRAVFIQCNIRIASLHDHGLGLRERDGRRERGERDNEKQREQEF